MMFSSLLFSSLRLEGSHLMEVAHLGLSVTHSAHCLAVGLCIYSHLLKEEALLMMADQGTGL